MPAGEILMQGGATSNTTYYGSGGTMSAGVIFSEDVILKSISTKFYGNGQWQGYVTVYRESDQARLSGTQSVKTATVSDYLNQYFEITMDNPITLTAGVRYVIGMYTSWSSGAYQAWASPKAATITGGGITGTVGPDYARYGNGDNFPATNYTNYSPWHGLYVDRPNTAPSVANLYSSSINPITDSKLTWTYSDPESNPQASYQIGWRRQGSGESHNFYQYDSANQYHTIPAGTLEEGVTYDWAVRVKDSGGLWSDYATSQFTSISPYRIETATNIATSNQAGIVLGSATVTNNYSWSGSLWTRVQPAATNNGARFYIPLEYLVDGTTYTISLTVANPTGSAVTPIIDWCDSSSPTAVSFGPGEVKKITFNGTRSTYNSTYRFLDIVGPSGSEILVKELSVIPGANKTPVWFNGDTPDTPGIKYSWVGTPGASPSLKEVHAYENLLTNPGAEAGSSVGWTGTSGTLTRSTSKAYRGSASFMFTHPSSGNVNLHTRMIEAKPGQKFNLKGRFSVASGTTAVRAARIDYAFEKADTTRTYAYTALTPQNIPTNGTWIEVSGDTVVAPPGTERIFAVFGILSVASGEFFHMDDLQVTEIHSNNYSPPPFDGNSTNTGFSTFNWTGEQNGSTSIRSESSGVVRNLIRKDQEAESAWSVGGWNWSGAVQNTGGYSGGKFQRITATAATQTAGMYLSGIWGVEAGKPYTLSCKLRPSAAGTTWRIAPEWRRPDGTQIYSETIDETALPANVWTKLNGVVIPPEGAVGVTFCMYKTGGNLPSGGYIDIDEPFMALSLDGQEIEYFDGGTTDTSNYQYFWEGAASTSTSVRSGDFWTELPEKTYNQVHNPNADGLTNIANGPNFSGGNVSLSSVAVAGLPGITTALQVNLNGTADTGWGFYTSFAVKETLPAGTKGKLRFWVRGISGAYTSISWMITSGGATSTPYGSFPGTAITSSWQRFEYPFTLAIDMVPGTHTIRYGIGNAGQAQVFQVTGVELVQDPVIDANSLLPGDYEVQVATQDADGYYGVWSPAETFTLGPASNLKVKGSGTFTTGLRLVKQGGVWVETGVTKVKSGGAFI